MVLFLIGYISVLIMFYGCVYGCLLLNDCYICFYCVLGVLFSILVVWKDIFRDNVILKCNWVDGCCRVIDMVGYIYK